MRGGRLNDVEHHEDKDCFPHMMLGKMDERLPFPADYHPLDEVTSSNCHHHSFRNAKIHRQCLVEQSRYLLPVILGVASPIGVPEHRVLVVGDVT